VSQPPHREGCTFHVDATDESSDFDEVSLLRAEIERLREERRSISTLHQKIESLEEEIDRLREENETLRDHWPTFWKPLPVAVKEGTRE
jgi:FtsZ-binding cell division protein ZapB